MNESIFLEICIDSVRSAIAAQDGGANRVELCDNLFEGGTTPSAGMIKIVRKNIHIDLYVMIRPRGGDFLYSQDEFEVMKEDIRIAKDLKADGVVIGLLNPDGTIDKERTAELVQLARPLGVTFHRAFDMTPDPFKALNDLIDLKVDRLLTSGLENTAFEGAELIAQLVKQAGNQIKIMAGAGITDKNISKIKVLTNASEFHMTARKPVPSQMEYIKSGISMGGSLKMNEYSNSFANKDLINVVKSNLLNS